MRSAVEACIATAAEPREMKVSKWQEFAEAVNGITCVIALWGAGNSIVQTKVMVGWLVIDKLIDKIFAE